MKPASQATPPPAATPPYRVSPPLDDLGLLRAWEAGLVLPRPWRELAVLEQASGTPVGELARLPVGDRDRRLLAVRRAVFGDGFELETACPACGERLELFVDAGALGLAPSEPGEDDLTIKANGWSVTFRLPDSTDVAAAGEPSVADPAAAVLERCVISTKGPPGTPDGVALPATIGDLVVERMEALDPAADLSLELTCPACRHDWVAPLDPASLLLEDVERHAVRLLDDVDQLARAYGWREPDVLALSPVRRRRYLELVAR